MQILKVDSVDYLKVAVEELEALSTELSGEVMVEAPDVQEELSGELDELQGLRNDISANGMTREAARKVNVAIESFLIRNHIGNFTTTPSIEGMAIALEAVDEKRGSVLQRLIQWFSEKMTKMFDWLKGLFEHDGKVEKTATTTKSMAEECEASRNTEEVARMAKDPKAAAQSARIDPSEEKSGTFEDFVDALEKNMEPVKEDINRLYARLNANKVMRVVASNPDSVKSFFDHMENTAAQITGVREIVDGMAKKIAAATNAQQALGDVKMSRAMLYRQLGGNDSSVLDSIRQTQFAGNEGKGVTVETVPYDELIKAMCAATKNIGAANAGIRIRELDFLKKAVEQLGKMEYSAVNKLSPEDREVVLSAAKGLVDDVVKYISADMENWNCVLAIYSGTSSFFNSELAVYFRVIGAIQRAATATFAEADRASVYEDFKKKGFNMDISKEELQRRGVGMESFSEFVSFIPALESIGIEHPGNFPEPPLFIGGGLMAALESEEEAKKSGSFGRRIIEWFKKILEWVRGLMPGRTNDLRGVVKKAKERRNQQSASVSGAAEANDATVKIFEKYLKDSTWWKSNFGSTVESKVSASFTIGLILDEQSLSAALAAIDDMFKSVEHIRSEMSAAKDISALEAAADSQNLSNYLAAKSKLGSIHSKVSDGKFDNLEQAINAVRGSQKYLTQLAKDANSFENIAKVAADIADISEAFFDKNKEAILTSQGEKIRSVIKAIGEIPQDIMSVMTTIAMAYSQALGGEPLDRKKIVEAMSQSEVEAGREALSNEQRASIVASKLWWDLDVAIESHDSMLFSRETSIALESLEETAPDVWGATIGYTAALEDDEASKATFRSRIKAVLQRIIDWFRNLFSKKKKEGAKQIDELREKVKKQREEAMKTPKDVLRPEVLKIFDKYYTDTAWFSSSKIAEIQATAIERSGVSFMYSGMTYQQFHAMADTDLKAALEFIRKVANASTFAQLPEPPSGPVASNIQNVKTGSVKFQSLKESTEVLMAWCKNAVSLKQLHDALGTVETLANDATKRLLKISDDSTGDQVQIKKIQAVSAALIAHVRNVTTFAGYAMSAAMECVMPAALNRRNIVVEILNHYKETNKDTEMNFSETDVRLLMKDRRWYVEVSI